MAKIGLETGPTYPQVAAHVIINAGTYRYSQPTAALSLDRHPIRTCVSYYL